MTHHSGSWRIPIQEVADLDRRSTSTALEHPFKNSLTRIASEYRCDTTLIFLNTRGYQIRRKRPVINFRMRELLKYIGTVSIVAVQVH